MDTSSSPTLMAIFSAADAGVPLGQPAPDLISVPLDHIVPCRWQPRQQFDEAALLDLANDIAQHGVLTPPLVWRNEELEYELIAGERRIRACYALFIAATGHSSLQSAIEQVARHGFANLRDFVTQRSAHSAPASVIDRLSVQCREVWGKPAQLHELALVDNLQRADLSPLEEARALHDLIQEYAYSQRDLAGRLGKSQTWISQRLNLLNLAPAVVEQVVAGEINASVSRDIARLDPAVQADVAQHIRTNGLAQKSAANLIGNILELADPESWASDGGVCHAYDVTIGQALAQAAPAERQRAMLTLAQKDSNGRLARPHDSYGYDKALVAVGVAEAPYQAINTAWKPAAAAMGRTCETCQLQARLPQIIEVQELRRAAGNRDERQNIAWPFCGMGERETCPAHRSAGERLSLHVPYDSRVQYSEEEQARIIKLNDWYQTTEDFATWYHLVCRTYRAQIDEQQRRHDQAENGVARALAGYVAVQDQMRTDHLYSQPCDHCAFHKRDAENPAQSCQHQAQPPQLEWCEKTLASTWQIAETGGEQLIGRCRLFRLRAIGLLPDFAKDEISIPRDAMLALLKRLSPNSSYGGENRSGARWLDVHRSRCAAPPPWSASEPALKKLLPLLTPGQQYALVFAWPDVIPVDGGQAAYTVFDPHAGKEMTFRRAEVFAVK